MKFFLRPNLKEVVFTTSVDDSELLTFDVIGSHTELSILGVKVTRYNDKVKLTTHSCGSKGGLVFMYELKYSGDDTFYRVSTALRIAQIPAVTIAALPVDLVLKGESLSDLVTNMLLGRISIATDPSNFKSIYAFSEGSNIVIPGIEKLSIMGAVVYVSHDAVDESLVMPTLITNRESFLFAANIHHISEQVKHAIGLES